MVVDISELLDDKRFKNAHLGARIENDMLIVGSADPSHYFDMDFSEVIDEGKTWSLYLRQATGGCIACGWEEKYDIPQGVEKIVIGTYGFFDENGNYTELK